MSTKKCNVEVFARVTGFFRPVQSWNKGKTAEFGDRKKYDISAEAEKHEDSRATKAVAG
jgi:ribonucleoside-triphosphate reductase